jgi:hypothetical protein
MWEAQVSCVRRARTAFRRFHAAAAQAGRSGAATVGCPVR